MFHQIGAHTWFLEPDHRSDRPSLGYIKGDNRAFAVDAGASPGHVELFYSFLQAQGLPLPDMTGISHSHWDHSYGAAAVHGLTLATELCNEILREEAGYEWTEEAMHRRLAQGKDIDFCYYCRQIEYPGPAQIKVVPAHISLTGDMTMDLGGVHVLVQYCKGPHSEDHLQFYVPEDRVLYVSDAFSKDLFGNPWTYDPAHPEQLLDSIAAIPYDRTKLEPYARLVRELDFEHCVLGHDARVLSRDEFLAMLA